MKPRREAFFLDAAGGKRFCLATCPDGDPVGGLLYLHPFAEELNKSRRTAALGARAFAERGWFVLQMDFAGCGDSAGDFGDATWERWIGDVALGWDWLNARVDAPLGLWSLRGGSLLAADWLSRTDARPPLLMWQPVTNGKQHLTQFLRLKAANEMLAESEAKAVMARIRDELKAGQAVEVAGYRLSPALASGLDAAALRLPPSYPSPVALLELGGSARAEVSPALQSSVARWSVEGVPVTAEAIPGPPFWQTQEIETAPALIERSAAILERFVK